MTIKSIRKVLLKFWPILFIFILWLIFSGPFFLEGRIPFPSKYLVTFFPPWASYQEFAGPVKNNAMPDIITQIYPWKKITIESLKNFTIPLWNPYNFSGNPHLANYQSAVLSPFNLLFFIFPFKIGWSLLILLQPFLSGLFMYLFLRSLKIGKVGSVLGSVSFMFCGFNVVWMAYGTLSYSILILPLALFSIRKFLDVKKLRYVILLTLSIPLSFFSGHFQISFYFLGVVLLYALYSSFKENKNLKLIIFGSILSGIFLTLPQVLPSIEFYSNSVRSSTFTITEAIPLKYLITSFAPDFFGNAVTRNDWFGHYAEWASFIGIVPLILAIFAIFKPKKEVIFFLFLSLFSLFLSIDSPLSKILVSLELPVISTSSFSRIIVLFSFSISVLAGFGVEYLKNLVNKKNIKTPLFVLCTIGTLIGFVWISVYFFPTLPVDKIIIAKRNLIIPTVLFIFTSIVVIFCFYFKKYLFIFLFGLLIISSFDSLRYAQKWIPFDPSDFVYPTLPIINSILGHEKNAERVFGNIGGEVSGYFSIQSVDGYDPLYIERYGEFLRGANFGKYLPAERSVAKLNRKGKYTDRTIDFLGAGLVFHPKADTNQSWAYSVWDDPKRFDLVYQDEKFELYRNNNALQRAKLFYEYEIVADKKKEVERFYDKNFDFKKKLILETDPKLISAKQIGEGKVEILDYSLNEAKIKVDSAEKGILLLTDNYYPGWNAYVNGVKEKVLRADYTFRGVKVPSGKSTVLFKYEPESFSSGLIGFVVGVVGISSMVLLLKRRYSL